MNSFIVTSTFCQPKVLLAGSHQQALDTYIGDLEASGRSYPEDAAVYILQRNNDDRRLYTVADGFFTRSE